MVQHAEAMTLEQLAGEIRRVTAAARDNTARREELSGSTITLTSLGKLGGIVSTPVINQPEVAIMSVGAIVKRPVVFENEVVVRHVINIGLTFDHRVIDGEGGARFLSDLKESLENYGASGG